ncbi:MAG: hypothetical protein WCF19_04220, partial [Chlamydiales bacterium]
MHRSSPLLVLASVLTLASFQAHGIGLFSWNVDASGSWEDSHDWTLSGSSPNSYPNGSLDVASFDYPITAPRTVTVYQASPETLTVNSIIFDSTESYSIVPYSNVEIVLSSDNALFGNITVLSGAHTISTGLNSPSIISLQTGGEGPGSVILAGSNSYFADTLIGSGMTLMVGSTQALSPNSTYNISSGGTLVLGTGGTYYDSRMSYLTDDESGGPWTVSMGSANLLLLNGGDFDGVIEGSGGIFLVGGTLALQGVNTFTGYSIAYSGTELSLNGSGSLSCPIQVGGNFSIAGITPSAYVFNQVLAGTGLVTLGSKTFEFASAETSTYSGSFTGSGGITISNGSVVLNGRTVTSDYSGTTTISNSANLTAATANCMSPNSPIYLAGTGSFVVQGSNTVLSISGDSDNNYTIDIQNTDLSLLQGGGMDINFGGV